MSPHPPVLGRPAALWKSPQSSARPGWREAFEAGALCALAEGGAAASDAAPLLRYRPDFLARIGPRALEHPELRAAACRHPAGAVALLCNHYETTAPSLELSLAGSGEAIFHLLGWAESKAQTLLQPETFYRQTLVQDCYWGIRHARRTRNAALLAEVTAWSADSRHRCAAAAAVFLMRHPREAVAPYQDVLVSNPFYAYWALPRLFPRGFSIRPEEVRSDPKWSYHFAVSCFSREPQSFEPAVATDPGWMIELAAARGWLADPEKVRTLRKTLVDEAAAHPLLGPAMGFLAPGVSARGLPVKEPAAGNIPGPLASGQAAEIKALDSLGINKNTETWRPSAAQIESSQFKRIVGSARYTDRGFPRGTVLDSVGPGFAEIKSGRSVLKPTYQLRLQTYRAVAEERAFKIYTNRPVDADFAQWLGPWGVEIEPLPDPGP